MATSARERALERKAIVQAEKDAQTESMNEAKMQAAWSVGAKDNSKQKQNEEKEIEKMKKKKEMEELLAQEESSNADVKRVVKTKKKDKDDFDFLNAALSAQPKTKAQREKEAKAKQAEDKRRQDEKNREEREIREKMEQEALKKIAAKGIVVDHAEDYMVPINNTMPDINEESIRSVDHAIDALTMTGSPEPDKNRKALYLQYCDRMLPVLREEMPGLKLSQYKERLFESWQRSPENPDSKLSMSRATSRYSSSGKSDL